MQESTTLHRRHRLPDREVRLHLQESRDVRPRFVGPVDERQRIGHLEMAEPGLLDEELPEGLQRGVIFAAEPVPSRGRPPPPARRRGRRQSGSLGAGHRAFVPVADRGYEHAERPEVARVAGVERHDALGLDAHGVGLARHPGVALDVVDEDESRPCGAVSAFVPGQAFEAVPRPDHGSRKGDVRRRPNDRLHHVFVRCQVGDRPGLDALVFSDPDGAPVAADHRAGLTCAVSAT